MTPEHDCTEGRSNMKTAVVVIVGALSVAVLVGCAPERLVGHSYGEGMSSVAHRAAADRALYERCML